MNLTGAAKTGFEIVDFTPPTASFLLGAACVHGITERGEPGKPQLVKSWAEFRRKFGGILPLATSVFPLLCYRALKNRTPLYIAPAGHYTDVTDKDTLVGVKATCQTGQVLVAEVRATGTITITAVGANTDTITAKVDGAAIGLYTSDGTDTPTEAATALAADITGKVATNGGFTATSVNEVVTVLEPAGSGAGGNADVLSTTNTGTATATIVTFAGGVTAVAANLTTWEATSIGTWANAKLKVTVAAAASGLAGYVDVKVTLTGYPELDTTVKDVLAAAQAADITALNNQLELVQLKTLGTSLVAGTGTAAAGARDESAVVTVDYIGSKEAQTGIYCFDTVTDAFRIAVPEKADPLIDAALAAYVDDRKDMMAVLRTPLGVTAEVVLDYRNGTGSYSHSPIDSWRTTLFTGGLTTNHPETGDVTNHIELGDALGLWANTDVNGKPWLAFGGPQRGRVKDALNVVYDLGVPSRQGDFDTVDAAGVNAFIKHPNYGVTLWGCNTLYRTPGSPLKDANVAALLIWLYRKLKVNVDFQLFEPNDPIMWRQLYLLNLPVLEEVKAQRGIYDFLYVGDQFAETIDDATLNTAQNIDAQKYLCNVYVKPVRFAKYIGFQMGVAKAAVSFEEILELNQ